MEANEISLHEVKLYRAIQKRGAIWATSKELANDSGIAERTARAHLLKLARLNVVDIAEVFPGHRYRISDKADKRNAGYITRLERASEAFGFNREGKP